MPRYHSYHGSRHFDEMALLTVSSQQPVIVHANYSAFSRAKLREGWIFFGQPAPRDRGNGSSWKIAFAVTADVFTVIRGEKGI